MKVLYVSHTSLVSGAEGALLDLLAALPAGVEGVLACPSGPLADRAQALAVKVTELPPVSVSFRVGLLKAPKAAFQLLAATRALRRAVAEHAPDLVHANTLRAGLVCGAALRGAGPPLVVHCHDVLPAKRPASLVRWVLNSTATAVLTISDYTAAGIERGRSRAPIEVLYNPLDVARFDPARMTRDAARSSLGFAADDMLLGLFAQITPWKGHELAIRTLGRLKVRYPQLRLLIVGEAKFTSRETRFDNLAFFDDLRRLITTLGLEENVEFWGERADVDVLMRAVDVALTPSWEEPFGRSVIEAMALQTPVVATSVGGPAEFIADGVDGLLAPPRDVAAWTEAITSLLASPDLRAELGRRGSVKVRTRFDRDAYVARVHAVYERVARVDSSSRREGPPAPIQGPLASRHRLRVLFVEYSSVMGGGQHSLLELMRMMQRDQDVRLACPRGPLAERAVAIGIDVLPIPDSQLSFRLTSGTTVPEIIRTLRARISVRREVARFKPDVVHANSLRAGLLTCSGRRSPSVVVHCRDLLPSGFAAEALSAFILATSSRVIAVSDAAGRRISRFGPGRRKVSVIDNPVNTDRFDPELWDQIAAKEEVGVPGGPLLTVIAQITQWKGQDRAVRMLDLVRQEWPDAKLAIAGSTKFVTPATRFDNAAYERGLKQLVHELNLDDAVIFLGERIDVERVLAATDVLLVPSTEEPFGRTIIEAMAMEVPIVATNAGGPPDIIRWGIDGFVLPPDDFAAWARAVTLLARRGRRAESRRYAIERFSTELHAAAVLGIYAQAMRRRATS